MKDLIIGLALGCILAIAIGVATGHLPRKDAHFAKAVQEAKKQLKEEMNLAKEEAKALVDAAKSLNESAAKLNEVSAQSQDNVDSHMFEDKLVEIQDQINELQVNFEKKSEDIKLLSECNKSCLNKNKPCNSKPKQTNPKKERCEETAVYKSCVKEAEAKWDSVCSHTVKEEKIISKMYDKSKVSDNTKSETHAALITFSSPKKHEMCLTTKDDYKLNCKKLVCN